MERFRSLRGYSRMDDKGSTQGHNQQAWIGSHSGQYDDGPSTQAYELRDRKIPSKTLASAFVEELPSLSSPRYEPVANQGEYNASRGLAEDHIGAGKVNTGYSPLFTRRWVLLCFAVLWVLILVAVQILYTVSSSARGLAAVNNSESMKYLWTYGPTAILVIVTVIWRQVDYAAKYVQPWAELARGPVSAKKSLLLDYITPLQVVAFGRAIKFRHITIVSTITIFVLIKAMTVISTGLLSSEFETVEGRVYKMRALKTFQGTEGLPLANIDSRAAVSLYGHQAYDMLLPNGTTLQYAFQPFRPDGQYPSGMVSYNASVDVFAADGWDCETGQLTYNLSRDYNVVDSTGIWETTPLSGYYNTTIKLPDCEIHHGHLDAPFGNRIQNDTHAEWGYWGIFQNVNCSNLANDHPKKQRFIISVAYSIGYGFNNQTILNSSNIVCTPSYSIQPAYVNMFVNGTLNGDIILHGQKRQLEGIDANNLTKAIYATTRQSNIDSAIPSSNVSIDGFMNLMVRNTPKFETKMLLDNDWLNRTSKLAYRQLGAQIANIYLLKDPGTQNTFDGTITRQVLRLVVRPLPTRLIEACAAIMLVLTLVMLFTMPQNVVPRSVESVAAVAVILARSPSLVQVLRNTGYTNNRALAAVLEKHRYMSTVADAPQGRTFSIRVISDVDSTIHERQHKNISWERPFVLRRVAMILTLVLAVCILIALEVLQRYSNAHTGIADVDVESLQKYAWQYTPVVVLVLLATTFNILDFELEFVDPYSQLARGYSSADRTLLWDPLRNISLKTTLQALQRSRWALMASSISVFFAPMLTIAVSGLFTARALSQSVQVSPLVQDWFNITSYSGYPDHSQYFAVPGLILQGNMTYPKWTYDELAFPEIDLSIASTNVNNATGGRFALALPAARASVNCSIVPQNQILNLTIGPGSTICDDCVNFNLSVADGCGNSGYIDSGMIWLTGATSFPTSGSGYFGGSVYSPGLTKSSDTNQTVNCPTFMMTYGQVQNRVLKSYAMHQCWAGLEMVQTNATVDANLATVVDVSVTDSKPVEYNSFWRPAVSSFGGSPYMQMINYTDQKEVLFDPFINTMVFGKNGVPPSELTNNDTFQRQFTHTYRQWVAQYINLYMRESVNQLANNATNTAGTLQRQVQGTFVKPDRHRLVLNEVSTRILQGVIVVLLICGLTILICVDMRKVLPKEVGTIGAVASLLAGSRLIDERSGLIPYGSEWRSDNELIRSGMWNGQEFRMGWWPSEEKIKDIDNHDTGYEGAAGQVYSSLNEVTKLEEIGEFRIDAKPNTGYS